MNKLIINYLNPHRIEHHNNIINIQSGARGCVLTRMAAADTDVILT